MNVTLPAGVVINAPITPAYEEILTSDAIAFLTKLQRTFGPRREQLLARRVARDAELAAGARPDFLPETAHIRDNPDWHCAPIPADLQDRRTEITGPTDRKMIINALNSGAKVFMADLEDSNTPTWANVIEGQINLRDAVNRTITFTSLRGSTTNSMNNRRCCWCARVDGTSMRNTSLWMAHLCPVALWISGCTSSTMPAP